MQPADNKFFEAYKHLDKICSEMYACQNGVSEYIAQMERKSYFGQAYVPSWDADYKTLKHIRWVRNRIAHDADMDQISKPHDLEFTRDFYNRIFSGSDPLTLLRKAIAAQNQLRRKREKQESNRVPDTAELQPEEPAEKDSRAWIGVLAFIGATVVLLLVVYYFHLDILSPIKKLFSP